MAPASVECFVWRKRLFLIRPMGVQEVDMGSILSVECFAQMHLPRRHKLEAGQHEWQTCDMDSILSHAARCLS